MLGDILLPNVTLERSGSYLHSKLERTSDAIIATLGGKPKLLVGVDVAPGSLELAAKLGYMAILADAANTPFRSSVAGIVASMHRCITATRWSPCCAKEPGW